jgi:putative ABC transport system permease protein
VRGALASDSSSNAALPQWKGRARLIASQVVCSVALVFMAVVIGEQIVPIRPSDSGMRLDGLAVANLSYPRHLRDETGQRQTLDTLLERARQQPGITSASLVGRLEFSGGAEGVWVTAPDRPSVKGAPAPLVAATPDVFAVLGIPTRKGRTFDARDTREAPPVIVLSETTARTLFDTTDALGRIVVFQDSPGRDGSKPRTVQATVVGVVGDIQSSASMGGTGHTMYVPYAQTNAGFIDTVGILVRAEDPAQALTAVRAQVRAIDQELGVVNAGVVIPRWEGALAMLRTLGLLASALGGLALVLAMAGLYGVLSQMVLRRRREIGLRMALGADRQTVLRLVLAQGLRPVLAGLLGGLFVGVTTRAILRSVFHSPWPAIDVFAIVVVPAFFFLAALAACFLPARRAASVDPNVALREL